MHNIDLRNSSTILNQSLDLNKKPHLPTVLTKLKNVLREEIASSGSLKEMEQLKIAAKLAFKTVRENTDNSQDNPTPNDSIYPEVATLSPRAKQFFEELTQGIYQADLNMLFTDQLSEQGKEKLEFFPRNRFNTETYENLLSFIDNMDNFLSSLPVEISLYIIEKYLSQEDQAGLRLVDHSMNNLVTSEINQTNPLANIKLIDQADLDRLSKILAAPNCAIKSLNLSNLRFKPDNLFSLLSTASFANPNTEFFIKLTKVLKENESLTNINLTGCPLNDQQLTLIAELPNRIRINITDANMTFDQKQYVLAAKSKGVSKLYSALSSGNTALAVMWANLILNSDLPDVKKLRLLAAQDSDGNSGFGMAIINGHIDTAKAILHLILTSTLTSKQQVKLLNIKNYGGNSSLSIALQEGDARGITVLVTAILDSSVLSCEQKVELLAAKDSNRISGLYKAMKNNKATAIITFLKLILNSKLTDEQKLELLAAKTPQKIYGLSIALSRLSTKAATGFIKHLMQHAINVKTLNQWMLFDNLIDSNGTIFIGCKLHRLLIAIDRDRDFLARLNQELPFSHKKILYQEIIDSQTKVINDSYPLTKPVLNQLFYYSSKQFWQRMHTILKKLEKEIGEKTNDSAQGCSMQ